MYMIHVWESANESVNRRIDAFRRAVATAEAVRDHPAAGGGGQGGGAVEPHISPIELTVLLLHLFLLLLLCWATGGFKTERCGGGRGMGLTFRPGESHDSMSRLGTPGTPASPGTRIGPYWKRTAGA